METEHRLHLMLPRGHCEKGWWELFEKANIKVVGYVPGGRRYRAAIPLWGIRVSILKPREVPWYLDRGLGDLGICGRDVVIDTGAKVTELLDLEYAKVSIDLCVHKDMHVHSLEELVARFDNKVLRIATELPNLAKDYVMSVMGREYPPPQIVTTYDQTVEFSTRIVIILSEGITEVKPPIFCDAIIEIVDSGTTVRANDLTRVDTVIHSDTSLWATPSAMKNPEKRKTARALAARLKHAKELCAVGDANTIKNSSEIGAGHAESRFP